MDDYARQDTPLHRLDARVKAVTTLACIVAVMSFPRYEVSALMPFLFYPMALTGMGRIPFGFILKKIIVASPFALAIAIFNPVFDREAAFMIGPVAVSGGWLSFTSIMLRFVLTVWAALALAACTGMFRLCAGLERLGMPRIFAGQLLFLHRYLFVVAEEGIRMKRALELRSGAIVPVSLRVYGSLVGHLLLRSMGRSERIHRAMVARGFSGGMRALRETALRPADWTFLLGWSAFFVAARAWNIPALIGALVTGAAP